MPKFGYARGQGNLLSLSGHVNEYSVMKKTFSVFCYSTQFLFTQEVISANLRVPSLTQARHSPMANKGVLHV